MVSTPHQQSGASCGGRNPSRLDLEGASGPMEGFRAYDAGDHSQIAGVGWIGGREEDRFGGSWSGGRHGARRDRGES